MSEIQKVVVSGKVGSSKSNYAELVKFLVNHEQSELYAFFNVMPGNDYEYLIHYFHYLEANREKPEFMKKAFNGWYPSKEIIDLTDWAEFRMNMQQRLQTRLTEIMKNLTFEPRVEKYVKQFTKKEQSNLRQLLMSYLLCTCNDDHVYNSLLDLGSEFKISLEYIFSITKEHPLITDGVIALEDSSILREKPFPQKEFEYSPIIFSIFSGFNVSDEDLLFFKNSNLVSLFGLISDELLLHFDSETKSQSEEYTEGSPELDPDFKDVEEIDITKLLSENAEKDHEPEFTHREEVLEQETSLGPYKDDLDYLWQEHQRLSLQIKILRAKKNEPLIAAQEHDHDIHKLEYEYQKAVSVCRHRLRRSIEPGEYTPRLENLARALGLSEFERNILLLLATTKLFISTTREHSDLGKFDIEDLMRINQASPLDVIKQKQYFTRKAKLVKHGLISISSPTALETDFYTRSVEIDNRLIEYFAGQNYDISEYIDGTYLYDSNITLANVILPDDEKMKVHRTISTYPQYLAKINQLHFPDVAEYGKALVFLFVGPSGTGKTMLANALAHEVEKKLLLFNLSSHNHRSTYSNTNERLFTFLFREARMNDAVLFFDEAEGLLEQRIQDLLVEIEKHEGIVIFATNATFRIDEAMHRRINQVVKFHDPSPDERQRIWDIHLPKGIDLDKDIDLASLAGRFEINGGLIKNAVFSAIAKAVYDSENELILTQKNLEDSAREQLQNKLFMSKMEQHKSPKLGLEALVVSEELGRSIAEILAIEKNKKILNNQWGFDQTFPHQKGTSILMHGSSGTGKTLAAECMAFETGKNLKVVNYAQILSKWVGEAEKALESLFSELGSNNSILLFDEADALFAQRSEINSASDRYANTQTDVLLSLIEQHNIFTILTSNFLENIDRAFLRRIDYILEFKAPDSVLRKDLWEKLTPPGLPVARGIDYAELAQKFSFTGGDIKNVIHRIGLRHAANPHHSSSKISMKTFLEICIDYSENRKTSRKIGFSRAV